jgi:hypothetical protein
MKNAALQGIKDAPETLSEAMKIAVGWDVLMTKSEAATGEEEDTVATTEVAPAASVFKVESHKVNKKNGRDAEDSDDGPTKKRKCFLCKKTTHGVLQCDRMEEAAAFIARVDAEEKMKEALAAKVHLMRVKPLDQCFRCEVLA